MLFSYSVFYHLLFISLMILDFEKIYCIHKNTDQYQVEKLADYFKSFFNILVSIIFLVIYNFSDILLFSILYLVLNLHTNLS